MHFAAPTFAVWPACSAPRVSCRTRQRSARWRTIRRSTVGRGRSISPPIAAAIRRARSGAWTGTVWNPCGLYISARAAAAGLDVADFIALDSSASPIVLVESFNVLEYGDEMALAHGLSDDDVLEDVQAMAGSTVRIARVSDFVELDQLERQRVEAA